MCSMRWTINIRLHAYTFSQQYNKYNIHILVDTCKYIHTNTLESLWHTKPTSDNSTWLCCCTTIILCICSHKQIQQKILYNVHRYFWNKNVFSLILNVSKFTMSLSSWGRVFHTSGPLNVKARSPYVLRFVRGIARRLAFVDRRVNVVVGEYGMSRSLM